MKKLIIIAVTAALGASAPFSAYSQVHKKQLNEIIEAVNRNHVRMRYFRDPLTKLVLTRSDADVLSDGDVSKVPKSKRINDHYRQNQLFSGLKLNPYAVNYTVIPDEKRYLQVLKNAGVKMKSLYYVIDIKTRKSSFGLVGDIGPGGQITNGEFSVHQILDLNLPVDKKTATGGKDANDIVTIIFPNSDQIIPLNDIQRYIDEGLQGALQKRINEEGMKLLNKYSDLVRSQNLNELIEAVKAETSSVQHYD